MIIIENDVDVILNGYKIAKSVCILRNII